MRNKYVYHSKISEAKFRQIVKCFSADLNATQISSLVGISRISVNRYLMELRKSIWEWCKDNSPSKIKSGSIELDESYFGSRRKGSRGRGALGKIIVFGFFKRNENVYTNIVPDVTKDTLLPIIENHASRNVVIHTDNYPTYDSLCKLGYRRHYRVNHSINEFANKKSHINGIEGFWGFAKNRLVKFNGVSSHVFELHLKECEFRFNMRGKDVYHELLRIAKSRPLFS